MDDSPQNTNREQRLLQNARREGRLIMVVWFLALAWSVGSAYYFGYDKTRVITPILGIPDWVFWSVFLPWGLCLLFSAWFCFVYMADDDLGQDHAGESVHE